MRPRRSSRSRRRQAPPEEFLSPSPPLPTTNTATTETAVTVARVYKRAIIVSVVVTLVLSWWVMPWLSSSASQSSIDPLQRLSGRMVALSELLLGANSLLRLLNDDEEEGGGGLLSGLLPNLTALVKPVAQWAAREDESSHREAVTPGGGLRAQGARVKHPVVMVPGIVSTGLELWEGEACAAGYFRQRPWGTLAMLRMMLLDKECWLRHLRILPNGRDPPGIRLRPARGIEAADWLMPGYWVWARVVENLAELGYDHDTLLMASYDWRLDIQQLEERDRYFTRLQADIELMVRLRREKLLKERDSDLKNEGGKSATGLNETTKSTNDLNEDAKAVVLCHSLGAQIWYYFMQWVTQRQADWVDQHVHAFVSIGGPMLGAAKSLGIVISGESRDTAQMGMMESFLLERFLSKRERLSVFRSWTGGMAILPIGGRAMWPNPVVTIERDMAGNLAKDEAVKDQGKDKANLEDNGSKGESIKGSKDESIKGIKDESIIKGSKDESNFKEEYYADNVGELLSQLLPQQVTERIERLYKREAAQDAADLARMAQDPGYWHNPLATPLPQAPRLRLYCLYGVGRPTELGYAYRMAADDLGDPDTNLGDWDQQSLYIPLHVHKERHDPEQHLLHGVYHDWQGDATVGVLSNGFMCTRGWRQSRLLNPAGCKCITREYQDDPTASRLTEMRGGPKSGDHVDILGNLEFLQDVLRIAAGFFPNNDDLADRYYSDIREQSARINLSLLKEEEKEEDGKGKGEESKAR